MKAREWFIVGTRLLGVWMTIECVREMVALAEVRSGMMPVRSTSPSAYLFHGVVDLLVGCLLLWGAAPLSRFFDWHVSDPEPPRGFPIEPGDENPDALTELHVPKE